jgi:hypothetical protein
MTRGYLMKVGLGIALLSATAVTAHAQVTSAFTYQGRLTNQAAPVSGTCNFRFTLWNAATGGAQVAAQINQALTVNGGLFSTSLDFGAGSFAGGVGRYLEVGVDCGSGNVNLPRQQVMATPYALTSQNALGIQGVAVSPTTPVAGQILVLTNGTWVPMSEPGDISAVTTAPGSGLVGGASTGAATLDTDPNVLQRRVGSGCAVGSSIRSINADGTVACEPAPGIRGWEVVEASCTYAPQSGVTSSCFADAHCPTGKKVIGGGAYTNCASGYIFQSYPLINAQGTWRWTASVLKRSDASCPSANTLQTRAICAIVD